MKWNIEIIEIVKPFIYWEIQLKEPELEIYFIKLWMNELSSIFKPIPIFL